MIKKIADAFKQTLKEIKKNIISYILRKMEHVSGLILFDIAWGFADDCQIEGDYLEFGSANGGSLIASYNAIKKYNNTYQRCDFTFLTLFRACQSLLGWMAEILSDAKKENSPADWKNSNPTCWKRALIRKKCNAYKATEYHKSGGTVMSFILNLNQL